jgi:hypothetical protein
MVIFHPLPSTLYVVIKITAMLITVLLNVVVQFNDTEVTKHVCCKVAIYYFMSLNNKTGNTSVT